MLGFVRQLWSGLGTGGRWAVAGGVAVLLLLGAGWYAVSKIRQARAAEALAQVALQRRLRWDDSLSAVLASTEADRDSLSAVLAAAKHLHGTLQSGVKIRIPKRDTTVNHPELATSGDSTRTATFDDSTFAGRIRGQIIAPPCCAPLSFRYSITRPEFAPEIGFVKVGDSTVVVISWRGEQAQAVAPYSKPTSSWRAQGSILNVFVRGLYHNNEAFDTDVGLGLNLKSWSVQGGISQYVPFHGAVSTPTWFIGLQRTFRLF